MKRSIAALLLCCSCALNPSARQPNATDLLLPSFEDLLPDGRPSAGPLPFPQPSASVGSGASDLVTALAQVGITLSSQELEQLRALTVVQPSGRWSRSQTQTAEQNLLANFRRFGPLFNPVLESAEEYRVQAVSFAEKVSVPYYLDIQFFLDTHRLLVVKWDEDSGEFVVVQSDGSLVNYLITRAIQPPRYVKIEF